MPTSQMSVAIRRIRKAVLLRDGAVMTDAQLMDCFIGQRDDAAFAALVRRHGPMVWGVCRRILCSHHDAEDAFQATFLVLVRKAASIVPREMVPNWLYGVAYQTARKARASTARRRMRERQAETMPEPAVMQEEVWRDLEPLLDQELSRLPDKYRVAIVLCDLEGKTRKEAAMQMGVPEGTLSGRLTRGRAMLGRRLARHGVVLSGGLLAVGLPAKAASLDAPASVLHITIKAAGLYAAGKAAPGSVSVKALALAERVLKTMLLSSLKITTAVLLGIATLTAATGTISYHALMADETQAKKPPAPPPRESVQPLANATTGLSRAEQLKAIQAEYQSALDAIMKDIKAGKIKAGNRGGYPELADLQKRFAQRVRRLVNANAEDEVALEAILFGMSQLVADANDSKLYDLLAAHHLLSPKLIQIVGRPHADEAFLRTVAAKSPHVEVRARATFALANHLARKGRPGEAELLLEGIIRDKELAKLSHHHGSLGQGAEDLLFEIRNLSVGKTVPEIDWWDMDDKPMKLSEYKGKVVLLAFWATWCGPCMAMVPHERELAKRHVGRPFAIVGVNGDGDIIYGPNKEKIDQKTKVQELMKREQITWRSFHNGPQRGIVGRWNVDSWPTLYVIDHQGVIRHKFIGAPGDKELDAAIEKLVTAAETERKAREKK